MREPFNTVDALARVKIKHLDGLVVLRGQKQAIPFEVESKMIEVACVARQRRGHDEL